MICVRYKKQNIHNNLIMDNLNSIFDDIYRKHTWGYFEGNGSGDGSEPENTEELQVILIDLMKSLSCSSIIDSPCGACKWTYQFIDKCSKEIPQFKYFGIDISSIAISKARLQLKHFEDIVNIEHKDMCTDVLPVGYDIILCRDALQHLSQNNIFAAIKNFTSTDAKWIILGGYPQGKNENIVDGEYFDFNPVAYPYNLKPSMIIDEKHKLQKKSNKHLFVFNIKYLRNAVKQFGNIL